MSQIDYVDVGVDTGGTFTDIVFQFSNGDVRVAKVPSTPLNPDNAVLNGIVTKAKEWGVSLGNIRRVVHGTTVATNVIIEREGAKLGIITTEGFRDVLEIGRQMRQEMYNLHINPVTPTFLAPRQMRLGVPERLSAKGEILMPLNEGAVLGAVDKLVKNGAEAIAICFLFSFINPINELRAREIIKEKYPDLHISLSFEVDPAVREYERTVVTAFDAYVKPIVDGYLGRIESGLRKAGIKCLFHVMQSRGGVASANSARNSPVRLVLSGPAGGVIAGCALTTNASTANLITVDVGGTSSDIALITNNMPVIRNEGSIAGFPVRVAMVDVNAIGAGGGSIAWVDAAGGLRVGPHSAGSEPGPACYGRGGKEPTVTDASIVLGFLNPDYFAAGSFLLDPNLSHEIIKEKIAEPLGMSVEEAALGIHRVVNSQMAEGIRLVSIKQGYDPRDFALVPMGGGGPIHAIPLARDLGIQRIVVPNHPGVMAASGLLSACIEHEQASSVHFLQNSISIREIINILDTLDMHCEALMVEDGAPTGLSSVQHIAEICYIGQSFHLDIEINGSGGIDLDQIRQNFDAAHDRVFGRVGDTDIEIVRLKSVHKFQPETAEINNAQKPTGVIPCRSMRRVVLPDIGAVDAAIVHRASIQTGETIFGPAIIEQEDTTTVIEPEWCGNVSADGSLILSLIKTGSQ